MQLITQTLESFNAFENFLDFTIWNATTVAFLYATCTTPASHKRLGIYLSCYSEYKIHKDYKDNFTNWMKLHMPSKQTCICLTHSVYAKCENGCVNETTIDSYHGSALKLRNTCRRSLTPRLVSWFSPVVPKVWVKTQRRV